MSQYCWTGEPLDDPSLWLAGATYPSTIADLTLNTLVGRVFQRTAAIYKNQPNGQGLEEVGLIPPGVYTTAADLLKAIIWSSKGA